MSLYTRARKHIDMKRVKEMREEKIREEVIAELERQQQEIFADLKEIELEESRHINWRKELEEGMTTSGLMTNLLPAEGDTVLDTATWVNNGGTDTENGSGFGGAELTLSGTPSGVVYNGGEIGFSLNLRDFDTLLVDVTTDGAQVLIFGSLANGTPEYLDTTSSGTYSIDISNESDTRTWTIFATAGTVTISNPRVQRKAPLGVFVGLDEPAASAFIRDGDFDRLSNEQKKKKLVQQLKSSEEYLNKMFGGGMPKGATQIADVQPQRSFIDIRTTARGTTDTGRTTDRGTTIPTPRQSSDDSQQSTGNPYADKYGLPADYQDKITKAYAYFQNNNYTLAGRTDMNASKDLMTKAYKMQGFTDKQIKSIRDNKLLQTRQVNLSQIERLKQKREQEAREKQAAERKQRQRELRRRQREARRQRQLDQRRNRSNTRTNRQQSYMDIKVGDKPSTSTYEYDPGKDYGNIAGYGLRPDGTEGFSEVGDIVPDHNGNPMKLVPAKDKGRGFNKWVPVKKAGGGKDTMIASRENPRNTGGSSSGDPANIQWPRNKYPNKKAPPGPGYRPPTAQGRRTMVAHHEPEGEVIVEKKRLKSPKDLIDKIPGYYDGKPSPLGFPVEEPPKMVNGYHPDLVDGKKVSNRYNRLDPISAKSMPSTGNPHIDKKVKAARKKPK